VRASVTVTKIADAVTQSLMVLAIPQPLSAVVARGAGTERWDEVGTRAWQGSTERLTIVAQP